MDVGCIGIGRMGLPIARRILQGGHRVRVYDINPAACAPLIEAGAVVCGSAAEVARRAQFIVTSVPGPKEVEAAIAGAGGILQGAQPGLLIIETSTIGPALSRSLSDRCAAAGVSYIDSPLSGGVQSARTGELTAMVGGEPALMEQAMPVLRCIATRIHHMGPIGSGNVAKLLNQIVFLSYVALFCEASALGARAGLDVPTLVEVLRSSVAGHPLMTAWEKHIESGDLTPGFQIARVLKDLDLGEVLCREQSYSAPIFQNALAAFRNAAQHGYLDQDMTALYVLLAS